jgi:hypothetical protein
MTPANHNFDIFKGAKWGHTLTLKVSGTQTPVDLTGLGPFVLTVKHPTRDEVLFNATVTSDYDDTGILAVAISSTQSDTLTIGTKPRYGLRDAENNPYMTGLLNVKYFAPDPS